MYNYLRAVGQTGGSLGYLVICVGGKVLGLFHQGLLSGLTAKSVRGLLGKGFAFAYECMQVSHFAKFADWNRGHDGPGVTFLATESAVLVAVSLAWSRVDF